MSETVNKFALWDRETVPPMVAQIIGRLVGFEPIAIEKDGLWTVGYNFSKMPDGSTVKEGDTLNTPQADVYLYRLLTNAKTTLLNAFSWQLNSVQAAALITFLYINDDKDGNLSDAAIFKMASAGRLDLVGKQMAAWSKDDGMVQHNKYLSDLLTGAVQESAVAFNLAVKAPTDELIANHSEIHAEADAWSMANEARLNSV